MAKQEIKLQKRVISPKKANSDYNKDFKEVSQSPKPINDDIIIDTYKEVFYNTPKKGKLSHESIIERSSNFLYPERASIIEAKIETRQEKIKLLNERLFKLSSPSVKEHPIYPDGTFIKINSPNTVGTNVQNPYIMQDGLKRYFAADYLYNIVRKAFGQKEQDFQTDIIYLSLQDAIQIPDGEEIKSTKDLNKKNITTIDRIEDIPSDTLEISCVGREQTDYIEDIGGMWFDEYSINLDEDCSLLVAETYYGGDGITLLSRIKEIKIPSVGKDIEANHVHTGAKISVPMSTVPEFIEPAYLEYQNNWITKEPYGSLVFEDRDKIWGKFADGTYRKFPAIIKAVGRMYYKVSDQSGNSMSKLLNGVGDDYLPDVPNHDGTTKSEFGTSMIYKDCFNKFGQPRSFCFGDLKQDDLLQQNYLNNPSCNYYEKKADDDFYVAGFKIGSISGDVYGQPIFFDKNISSNYLVLLGVRYINFKIYGKTIFEGSVSLFKKIKNDSDSKHLKIKWNASSWFGGSIKADKHFDYKGVRGEYIQYLGLKGKSLNNGKGFSYNPNNENGSNDGLTSYMKQWL